MLTKFFKKRDRGWYQEDFDILKEGYEKNISFKKIAKQLNRSTDDIFRMLYCEYNSLLIAVKQNISNYTDISKMLKHAENNAAWQPIIDSLKTGEDDAT
jgi:DNA-directed RNA polymerase specialized sigma subunit